jgi:hypothetical protein
MKQVIICAFILLGISFKGFTQEEKFKALFIYNFTKHIEWPASAKSGDFIIGVVNDNVLYDKIVEITTGKMAGAQKIVVVKFANPEEITKCHILFVSGSSSGNKNLPVIMEKTAGQNTLLVTERPGLATKGASINFVVQDGKLKFELNKNTAAEQSLKVSSYLENLAIII